MGFPLRPFCLGGPGGSPKHCGRYRRVPLVQMGPGGPRPRRQAARRGSASGGAGSARAAAPAAPRRRAPSHQITPSCHHRRLRESAAQASRPASAAGVRWSPGPASRLPAAASTVRTASVTAAGSRRAGSRRWSAPSARAGKRGGGRVGWCKHGARSGPGCHAFSLWWPPAGAWYVQARASRRQRASVSGRGGQAAAPGRPGRLERRLRHIPL